MSSQIDQKVKLLAEWIRTDMEPKYIEEEIASLLTEARLDELKKVEHNIGLIPQSETGSWILGTVTSRIQALNTSTGGGGK